MDECIHVCMCMYGWIDLWGDDVGVADNSAAFFEVYIYMFACMYVHVYVRMHTCMDGWIRVCMHGWIDVRGCIWLWMYIVY